MEPSWVVLEANVLNITEDLVVWRAVGRETPQNMTILGCWRAVGRRTIASDNNLLTGRLLKLRLRGRSGHRILFSHNFFSSSSATPARGSGCLRLLRGHG